MNVTSVNAFPVTVNWKFHVVPPSVDLYIIPLDVSPHPVLALIKYIELRYNEEQTNQFTPEFVVFKMFCIDKIHPVFASVKKILRKLFTTESINILVKFAPAFVVLKTSLLLLPASSQ